MWLKISRYFIIILSILSHGILGTLATGNLIFGGLAGVDLSINAFTSLLGMAMAVFMMIIILVELNQRHATTSTLLFECIWVGVLWATNAVAASYISKSMPAKCLDPRHLNWKWDVCVTYSLLVPGSWISATVVTAHVLVLVVLVQWHRSRGTARPRPQTTSALSVWSRFTNLLKDEAFVMSPILDKSVYSLLQIRSTVEVGEKSFGKRRHTLAPSGHQWKDPRTMERSLEDGADFSDELDIRSPYSDAPPAYLSPPPTQRHARFDSVAESIPDSLLSPILAMYAGDSRKPKFQLRDEPSFEILAVPKVAQPPLRTKLDRSWTRDSSRISPPNADLLAPPSVGRRLPSPTPSPSSPRFPTRSRTLPSHSRLATPPPVRYSNGDIIPAQHPALSRSRTVAGTRRLIPSRYGQIDLVAAGYIERMSTGSPGPTRLPL